MTPAAIYAAADGSYAPKSVETSLVSGFSRRTGLSEPEASSRMPGCKRLRSGGSIFGSIDDAGTARSYNRREPLQHLDYTHPFAHRPLVEFLMTVPADVLCRPGEPRRLMRSALSDLWPLKLRERRSKGLFNAPWQEALRPMARVLLNARELHVVERGFVDGASVCSRLERLSLGLDCNESQLRQIILLELWLRNRDGWCAVWATCSEPHERTSF